MFRKSKILLVLPLTIELRISSKNEVFIFSWNDQEEICEVIVHDDMIKKILIISRDYARYQKEPFFLGCEHHRWLWFYQDSIPNTLQTASQVPERKDSLLFDHYGKPVMEAYVSKKLKSKEEEYTSVERLSLCVLSWNTAGNPPKGNLSEWILCQSIKYQFPIKGPELIVIGLQEMCELTKLLGDKTREKEWVEYLQQQIQKAFDINYLIVN